MQCGISPDYVLDKMELYEIDALMDNLWRKDKESWEQTRSISYVTAQVQSRKPLDPKDIMTFPWEKEATPHIDSKEELDEVWREMKAMEKKMNKK